MERKRFTMLTGTPVELPAMLMAREARAMAQQAIQHAHPGCTLISFCLNIPGPVKTNDDLRRLFDDGLLEIEGILQRRGWPILEQHEQHAPTGDECLLAASGDPTAIKKEMTALEESHPLGRLFDIDVLDAEGHKLSRAVPRRCLLCGKQAQDCARSRRHSVEDLTNCIQTMLSEFLHK